MNGQIQDFPGLTARLCKWMMLRTFGSLEITFRDETFLASALDPFGPSVPEVNSASRKHRCRDAILKHCTECCPFYIIEI
jgi:hypothetical protein